MSENDVGFYAVVPPGFNLLEAPPGELDRYGIPPKPDAAAEPGLFEFWKKLVSQPFSAERPTFRELDTPLRGGPRESMLNWSGALIPTPPTKRFVLAAAGWTAPNVRLPPVPALDTPSDRHRALVWVGLDGKNGMSPTVSLPQIGTAHEIGGKSDALHFAWWDWWHKSRRRMVRQITNLPVQPDDEILAGLAVLASDDVLFFIKNQGRKDSKDSEKKGQFRSFLAKRAALPAEIEPPGDSVEWIVERPTDPPSEKLHALPDYRYVDFRHCVALAADRPHAPGRLMTLADNTVMIDMRESFANPYRTVPVSLAKLRPDQDGSIGVTCTFDPP
jgi:Peptidase A4 family